MIKPPPPELTQKELERECERNSIRLFVLPPRSPKLNVCVERTQRTYREEFYDITDVPPRTMPELNKELRRWEYVYKCIRPHQALGYKTPLRFLKDNGITDDYKNPPPVCLICPEPIHSLRIVAVKAKLLLG
ncbi:MAG: hypothetical protein E2O70_08570 [Candidatus Dadabacteria bacterium]|nr:MAG: hypothetical protein E2O70_08570 [Candidatus Dadabacteria bacterium]